MESPMLDITGTDKPRSSAKAGNEIAKNRWRLRYPGNAIAILLFCVCGALGALPYIVSNWDGTGTRYLKFERALLLTRVPSTPRSSVGALLARLLWLSKDAITAIQELRTKGGDYRKAADRAVGRLSSLFLHNELRRQERTIPAPISFEYALKTLQDPRGETQYTWDCLEVVVYSLEELALHLATLQDGEGGDVGRFARVVQDRLGSYLVD